jgi:hypothetical protein
LKMNLALMIYLSSRCENPDGRRGGSADNRLVSGSAYGHEVFFTPLI